MLNSTLFIINTLKTTISFLLYFLQDRLPLKRPTHRAKLKKLLDAPMPHEARAILYDCGLLSLVDCSLTMLYVSLLTTFIERWHKETSSVHLPFGEMAITLDDVSSLFHLPIPCTFFTTPLISQHITCINVIHNLGVIEEQVL